MNNKKKENKIDLARMQNLLDGFGTFGTVPNKKHHRIFHILNRNVTGEHKRTFDDIKKAFSLKDLNNIKIEDSLIHSKFFKECETNDLPTLIETFDLDINIIKEIYANSTLRIFQGIADIWDPIFNLPRLKYEKREPSKEMPKVLQDVFKKKENETDLYKLNNEIVRKLKEIDKLEAEIQEVRNYLSVTLKTVQILKDKDEKKDNKIFKLKEYVLRKK